LERIWKVKVMDEKEALKLSQDNLVKALESWIDKLERIERKLRRQGA